MKNSILLLFILIYSGFTCDYSNGVHLINEDTVSHTFFYYAGTMSTRICWINTPTEQIKKGIAPYDIRTKKKVVETKRKGETNKVSFNSGINVKKAEAVIAPQSEICCLKAGGARITINGYKEITLKSGSTLLFKENKLWVILNDGAIIKAEELIK